VSLSTSISKLRLKMIRILNSMQRARMRQYEITTCFHETTKTVNEVQNECVKYIIGLVHKRVVASTKQTSTPWKSTLSSSSYIYRHNQQVVVQILVSRVEVVSFNTSHICVWKSCTSFGFSVYSSSRSGERIPPDQTAKTKTFVC
jgi:hypothetical protein